ncbi:MULTISPECIES: aquaporin [Chelatococcus]|nr:MULTISPECIES: aquaporin [Chelatococcus]ALA18491.1 porin [Chelatococcus sp. CO-6]
MKKYLAELLGTACLVLFGCGSVVLGGYGATFPLGMLPVAFAFGLAVTAMAYGIGPVSGCHINPAVTIAVWSAGRMPTSDVPGYIIAQCLGGIVGAAILLFIASGRAGGYDVATGGLGQNGWGEGYLGAYGTVSAAVAEFVATFLFTAVILGATSRAGATPAAGLAIGLTLVVIHIVFINVTGVSVNPARSLGPAVFVGGQALAQLWLFIVAPILGGLCAGLTFRSRALEA